MPLFNPQKPEPFYCWEGDTLVLNILGRPNAQRDAIGKVVGHQLEVYATAVPRLGGAIWRAYSMCRQARSRWCSAKKT